MSIDMKFVAMDRWPQETTPPDQRMNSRFRAAWSDTIGLLERELAHLAANDVVIQADCDRDQLRIDGHLRAKAKLRGPGVVISFGSKGKSLAFPCDRYFDWRDNVRAIALTLEHLRAVDRYGVTQRDEQYTGWAKLPGPVSSGQVEFIDRSAALQFLSDHGIPSPQPPEALRKLAIRAFHPDRHNGSDGLWKQWLSAARVLGIEV